MKEEPLPTVETPIVGTRKRRIEGGPSAGKHDRKLKQLKMDLEGHHALVHTYWDLVEKLRTEI
jgi:hypothetical protein